MTYAMENKKKALMQTGIVCALAAVLVLLWSRGAGRSALRGLWQASSAPSAQTNAPDTANPRLVVKKGATLRQTASPVSTTRASRAGVAPVDDQGRPVQVNYTAFGARDPFVSLLPKGANPQEDTRRPLPAPPRQAPPALRVQGILWGGLKPEAIINERIYRVHESIEGATIMSIDAHGVTIEHQGALVSYPVGGPPPQPGKQSIGRSTVGR